MRGRASQSIVANPVLVGAVTTLVIIVAVFLAYNANNGLPFVPTRAINVQIPSGSNLVRGNEVRQGGFRVGVIQEMVPVRLPSGTTGAELRLKLDRKVGEIPRDSKFHVRPRSTLGLKYLELVKGTSEETFADGDTVQLGATEVPVDLDDLYNIFDRQTRDASRTNLKGFGNTFAFRGQALNETITLLPNLLGNLERVMANLADPETGLRRFFEEQGDAARIVAPVAREQAEVFTAMADTFEAFSRDPEALKETISESPPTLDVSTRSLRVQRPFLNETAEFSRDLRFAVGDLRGALPPLNAALETGTPVQRRSVALNERLEEAMGALRELAEAPTTLGSLRGLTATVDTLNPMVKFLGPYQTVCNNWNYMWTTLAEHLAESEPTGTSERAIIGSAGGQDNSVAGMGAYGPANGKNVRPGSVPQYLHGQPAGAAVDKDGNADCEIGQRGFPYRINRFGNPGDLVAVDPHTPGNQGPTFRGRARVPDGQTWSSEQQTGTLMEPELRQP